MIAARVLLGLCAWLALGLAAPAFAAVPDHWITLENACHAVGVTPPAGQDGRMPAQFSCTPDPRDYQHGSLWIKVNAGTLAQAGANPVLMVHSSRFDALRVGFFYADGSVDWQGVARGDYGARWRLGGQIAFIPPDRDAPLSGVVLRFDRVSSAPMLRMRLIDGGQAQLQATAMASMIGAALMLLALGAVYNFGLAIAVRRQFPAWQGAWATCMVAWGAMWSQFHLFFLPGLAGAVSAQACTALSCLATLLATFSLLTALDPVHVPKWLGRVTRAVAITCCALGVPLSVMRSGPMEFWAGLLGILVLLLLVLAGSCLIVAWRRGSAPAKAFVGAWAVPMIVMGSSGIIDVSHAFWGGGSQMMVLAASSWQTVWLAVAATRRFMGMRIERDRALMAEAAAQEQARRDPLTGLRNRRGFLEAIAPLLDRVNETGGPTLDEGDTVALLLLDVDRFKMINDSHGHEAGDAVLVTLARRLARWDGALCISARLGGEEFALLTSGMGRFAALQLAESVRAGLGACDHGAIMGPGEVTVSIGVALARPGDDFAALYRTADAALYAAKHQGRNRVVIAPDVVYAESEHGLVMPRIASID
ncbi:hypothetical protein GCM10019060_02280 [Novosphingobium pokkalii]|nr:hypothetical protein GCM10019060_02280 [Novosphingobium pokkalii]